MGKTEQMENSHLWFSECRKVTTHKCPSINVNGNRISVLAIMKKIEKWLPFHKYRSYRKFQITDLPKIDSPVFQVSTEMEYQCWPL